MNGTVMLRLGWRTRVRAVACAVISFAAGVVALTAGASPIARIVAAAIAIPGVYWFVDLLVATRFWRFTPDAVRIPTIRSMTRVIPRSAGIEIALVAGLVSAVSVSGTSGTRRLGVNPLASAADLQRWFDVASPVG